MESKSWCNQTRILFPSQSLLPSSSSSSSWLRDGEKNATSEFKLQWTANIGIAWQITYGLICDQCCSCHESSASVNLVLPNPKCVTRGWIWRSLPRKLGLTAKGRKAVWQSFAFVVLAASCLPWTAEPLPFVYPRRGECTWARLCSLWKSLENIEQNIFSLRRSSVSVNMHRGRYLTREETSA